ncbi:hypothetical protein Tco_0165944 [Tanacetum coccineum]
MAVNGLLIGKPEEWVHPCYRRPKKRTRSLCEKDDMVVDGKLSKKWRTVTCQSCGHLGHNKLSCKGQGKPSKKWADTSGGVFGNQGQASGSQAVGSQADIVENQVVGS